MVLRCRRVCVHDGTNGLLLSYFQWNYNRNRKYCVVCWLWMSDCCVRTEKSWRGWVCVGERKREDGARTKLIFAIGISNIDMAANTRIWQNTHTKGTFWMRFPVTESNRIHCFSTTWCLQCGVCVCVCCVRINYKPKCHKVKMPRKRRRRDKRSHTHVHHRQDEGTKKMYSFHLVEWVLVKRTNRSGRPYVKYCELIGNKNRNADKSLCRRFQWTDGIAPATAVVAATYATKKETTTIIIIILLKLHGIGATYECTRESPREES